MGIEVSDETLRYRREKADLQKSIPLSRGKIIMNHIIGFCSGMSLVCCLVCHGECGTRSCLEYFSAEESYVHSAKIQLEHVDHFLHRYTRVLDFCEHELRCRDLRKQTIPSQFQY